YAPNANGFDFKADNCTLKGLIVNQFVYNGVLIEGDGNAVLACFIGTDSTGTKVFGVLRDAVAIAAGASNNTIGGANGGNLIAGSGGNGVSVSGAGADGNLIARNTITNNLKTGVSITGGAKNNTVGGGDAALANTIVSNGVHGVAIAGVGTSG